MRTQALLRTTTEVKGTISLNRGQLRRLASQCREIRVHSGVVWLTSQGRLDDVVLAAGDCFRVHELDDLLLESLTEVAEITYD